MNREVGDAIVDGLVVNMEYDMRTGKPFSPAENGVNDSEHLFDLDVLILVATRASYRKPA